jgi:serine phosphatase RsbU (regulator of sigma subunit)
MMRQFLTAIFAAFVACIIVACSDEASVETKLASHADSLIFDAGGAKDYKYMLALIDSFEHTGDISSLTASRWRGAAYYRQNQYRTAEYHLKKAVEDVIKTPSDQLSYIKSARRLSELLLVKGDYEGAIQVAMPAVAKMNELGIGSDIDYAILLNNIGCCQINLGRDDEAQESFYTARQHYINRWTTDSTGRGFQEAVIGTVYTSLAYINTRRYDKSEYWINRTEMLLKLYNEKPDARFEYFDEYKGRIAIMRAVTKMGLEQPDSAAMAYQEFLKTEYSKTSAGRIYATEYLMAAKRYTEAADNYGYLDQMLTEHDMEKSLDNIQLYDIPKIRANIGANRRDSVIHLAIQLCDALDSAIVKNKSDDTAELATIYNTQQKEAQIAKQQAELSRQRWVSTMVALGLLVIFFVIYTLYRRKAVHKLAVAHDKLKTAYDQLEKTTAVKERIESELRIARDIQMSMVPNVFPNHEGLDIYATMIPAKEVGGDLYGYLLLEHKLYFCVGDVSGKGVPASLFMAQATRLFRTLATQKMMPAEIATRMNAELAEDNEQGMFVTMFIGLADLDEGKLYYCNAGHNPPVIGGTEKKAAFMQMEPNAPIGLWPGLEFIGETIENFFNCPLLLYTDGLNEAENDRQEQFGEERIISFLTEKSFGSAKNVIDALKDEVDNHRNGAAPNDDLTLMCLKIKTEDVKNSTGKYR